MADHQSEIMTQFIDFIKDHKQHQVLQSAYYQLGFICSVQALPDSVDLSVWLNAMCRGEQAISFDSQAQAIEYAQMVLKLVEHIQVHYQEAIPLNDLECERWLDNQRNITNDAADFANGFLDAVQLLNDKWVIIENNPATQGLFQTTILLLTKLTSPEGIPEKVKTLIDGLPEPAEIMAILPKLLSNLAYNAAQH